MRAAEPTRKYARDFRRIAKRGWPVERLDVVVEILCVSGVLPRTYSPHKLKGEWSDFWECHIAPDWLLIYAVSKDTVTLYRTGSHNDLFE